MGKSLLALCLATGTIASAHAEPFRLPENLRNGGIESRVFESSKDTNAAKRIQVKMWTEQGKAYSKYKPGYTNLMCQITDGNTAIEITDYGADGAQKNTGKHNDRLVLTHNFVNGGETNANLIIDIQYRKSFNYEVKCVLRYSDGFQLEKSYDTASPFWNCLARLADLDKVEAWGKEIYAGLVEAIAEGKTPKLPTKSIREELNRAGNIIPRLRHVKAGEREKAGDELTSLSMDFLKHAKERQLE